MLYAPVENCKHRLSIVLCLLSGQTQGAVNDNAYVFLPGLAKMAKLVEEFHL
jgi:hypothetical protein